MADKTFPERHTDEVFRGKIELDVRDSVAHWGPLGRLSRAMRRTSWSSCTTTPGWQPSAPPPTTRARRPYSSRQPC